MSAGHSPAISTMQTSSAAATARTSHQRHSHLSMTGSLEACPSTHTAPSFHGPASHRNSFTPSRRSSQSSVQSARTVATAYSVNSTATSASICSAKFDKAYANQAQLWTATYPGLARQPSLLSQYSIASVVRNVPAHIAGKGAMLQRELKTVEALLTSTADTTTTTTSTGAPETGSTAWMLCHERSLLTHAIRYDTRAHSEWEASMDWRLSAAEGPVSKIFVTQPSRFGLTPAQHRQRLGQARTLENNAMDLWRFSDLKFQEAYKLRGFREKLQAEQREKRSSSLSLLSSSSAAAAGATQDGAAVEEAAMLKDKTARKDFQTWLSEVSKNGAAKPVFVKDDGTLDKLEALSLKD